MSRKVPLASTARAPWGTADGVVPLPTVVNGVVAVCVYECVPDRSYPNPDAAASWARRHTRRTGHDAAVSITRVHRFHRAEVRE